MEHYNYLIFHTTVEAITIFTSFIMATVILLAKEYLKKNAFISIIGVAFFYVASLDFLHLLSYSGMPFFLSYGTNLPTSLWIAARYIQSFAMLIGMIYWVKSRTISFYRTNLVFLFATLLAISSILLWQNFPKCYVDGVGLTQFKIFSEYIIMIIYIVSLSLFIFKKNTGIKLRIFLLIFTISQILLGALFTLYLSPFSWSNTVGHIFKLIGSVALAIIIIDTAFKSPHMVLFERIRKSERKLRNIVFTDSLTGLKNNLFLGEYKKKLNDPNNHTLTILVGDINNLRFTNDTLGRNVGNDYIKEIAKGIQNKILSKMIAGRYSGGLFYVLMPNRSVKEGIIIKEELINHFDSHVFNGAKISFTIGLAEKTSPFQSFDETFKKAEEAMFKQKINSPTSLQTGSLLMLNKTLFEKSSFTQRHCERVSVIAYAFGEVLNLRKPLLADLQTVSLIHDIGKIGISDQIINHEGKLSHIQFEEMKKHSVIGYNILKLASTFREYAFIVYAHHERYDGKGYPNNLVGDEIPYLSRILTLAESFEAMVLRGTSEGDLNMSLVIQEMNDEKGKQFDPKLTDIFIENIDYITAKLNEYE